MIKLTKLKRNKGFGLVELMIGLVLSLVIGAAVVQLFLSSKTTYRVQDAMARIQENGRFAVGFLARDIRMAGYMGCGNIDQISINVIAEPPPIDAANPLGQIVSGSNNVPASNNFNALAGTDIITLRRASSAGTKLVGNMSTDNANIQIEDNSLGLISGDTLFLSDCTSADIFRATNVSSSGKKVTIAHASNMNSDNKLSKAYGSDAELMAFEAITYFIRDTGRKTSSGDPIRALWVQRQFANRSDASAAAAELVEGVENMQIEYGMEGENVMVTADAVTDWSKVARVRFSLLLQSLEGNITPKTGSNVQNLVYDGQPVEADGRLRQVFGTMVAIRNRVR
ncbi:type IV pilus assembly protein PilW [Pseudomonas duriflava]|uniref:Type IV pilus assembly protein PilW n=1 Tax=Pseudomonas duriflava TaxID=459528 RepID=A0A562QDT3_9PSED|nr:PilW family protein [Pseudomonas duriflava]TWI54330.1 type IV pilus assembly protein PilW [Pseudomonas duriflava]